ncbi:HNH endonuclease [Nocardioides agariphilus]|nr:HNH endonuclease [Nocardioides agariphilus]
MALGLPRIGKFVERHVLSIVEYCDHHPEEFEHLRDESYCKSTLGVRYPFFRSPDLIVGRYEGRYRSSPQVVVCGETVLFTNDWYARHYVGFVKYIADKQMIDQDTAAAYLDALSESVPRAGAAGEAGSRGRLAAPAIGNAQNLLVRNVLGRIRPDAHAHGGWESTWSYFGGRCAYCDEPLAAHDKDHVFGINSKSLGEHKRGNLVPACKDCNSEKGDEDFRDFLDAKFMADPATAEDRKAAIFRFMLERDYLPFALDPQVDPAAITALLDQARTRVQEVATEYVAQIRSLVTS